MSPPPRDISYKIYIYMGWNRGWWWMHQAWQLIRESAIYRQDSAHPLHGPPPLVYNSCGHNLLRCLRSYTLDKARRNVSSVVGSSKLCIFFPIANGDLFQILGRVIQHVLACNTTAFPSFSLCLQRNVKHIYVSGYSTSSKYTNIYLVLLVTFNRIRMSISSHDPARWPRV